MYNQTNLTVSLDYTDDRQEAWDVYAKGKTVWSLLTSGTMQWLVPGVIPEARRFVILPNYGSADSWIPIDTSRPVITASGNA